MFKSSKWLAALCIVSLTCGVGAQGLIVPLMSELSNVGYQMDARIKNNLAEAIREKNLTKFREHLMTLRRSIYQTQTKVAGERKLAQTKMSDLRRSHADYGSDPAKWPESARTEYNEAKSVDQGLAKVEKEANEFAKRARETFAWSSGLNARTFSQLSTKATQRLHELQSDVAGFNGAVKSMKTAYQPSRAGNLSVQNSSRNIDFVVGSLTIKPGQTRQIKMPSDRMLTLRALAMTTRRQYVMTKPLTPHATLNGTRTPNYFSFTIDTGAGATTATWKVEKEEYIWNVPTHKLQTSHTVTSDQAKDDVINWKVPVVSKARFGEYGAQVFTVAVRGDIEWSYLREGAMPRKTDKEFEHFDGYIVIKVQPE